MVHRILYTLLIALAVTTAAPAMPVGSNDMSIPLLRLKLVLDEYNNDDIAIGFLSTATTQYNNQIDSRYLPGIDAPEGLSSFSSDNVPLTVNIVPLPSTAALVIRLDVEAKNSGAFTLQRTQLDSIPQVYDIWLVDKYAKDSLNLRSNTSYAFNINKSDTSSFGSGRFTVVIRQSPAMMLHLLGFSAKKAAVGNLVSWTTENEQSSTIFSVERSIDKGTTFFLLDSLSSDGSGSYTYADKTPIDGTDLYRLRMQDMNGVITYSNSVAVDDQSTTVAIVENNKLSVYPNPSSGVINLAINPGSDDASPAGGLQISAIGQSVAPKPNNASAYAIKIVNIRGVVVRSATSSSANWQDNLGALTPGTYFISVVNAADNKVVGKSTFVKL